MAHVADITIVNLNMLYVRYFDTVEREIHLPLGPLYVASALQDAGYTVDFCYEQLTYVPGCENMEFYEYFDLDTGTVCSTCDIDPRPEDDFHFAYGGGQNPLHLSQEYGREVAFLDGIAFSDVDSTDLMTAIFDSSLIGDAIDHDDTVLLRTELGDYYKIGWMQVTSETSVCVTSNIGGTLSSSATPPSSAAEPAVADAVALALPSASDPSSKEPAAEPMSQPS